MKYQDQFTRGILKWYSGNKRDLPWRQETDPYKIWLSEVILQQTRVAQGLPYYNKFITTFPTVNDLANASEQEVLRVWQGLGYYSRARNLHRCAKIVAQELGGNFPNSAKSLLKLPGIGPYTAAAIASFVFNEAVAVVDGNVYRVLSRVFGIEEDISSGKGQKYFQTIANILISKEDPADYNQGIMEFGALHCTPKDPQCQSCPFGDICLANKHNLQRVLPVKLGKVKVRERFFNYLVIKMGKKLALQVRKAGDIWQGLYDFPMVETDRLLDMVALHSDPNFAQLRLKPILIDESNAYKHILSHQRLHAKFFEIEIDLTQDLPFEFYSFDEIHQLPKPVLITSYLKDADF